jgi:phage recombination protein Bet
MANEQEIMHFLAVAKYHRLNPWLREAYLIKYAQNQAAQIVVGKDFYNRRAQEFPTYKGHAAGIILQVNSSDGKIVIERRTGAFHTDGETLLGGWAKIHRSDLVEPIEIEVQLREYDKQQANWKSMPSTMIRKVALSQAWREAFPKEFEGLYDEAEVADKQPLTIDMPQSNAQAREGTSEPEGPEEKAEANGVQPDDPQPPTPDAALEAEARAREQAEAPAEKPKNIREQVWEALKEKAKQKATTPTRLLYQMTKKQGISELSDAEVQGLLVQL